MKKILITLAFLLCGVLQWGQEANAQSSPGQQPISSQSEANCTTAIDRCMPPPKPKPCPPGSHWSLAGTGIAHCVLDTPTCPPGTELKFDGLGNPSCVPEPPKTCSNGASDWPTCTPPTNTCSNGASDWPTCTPPTNTCSNGASDWPTCTPPTNTCSNGASDWPTCTPPTGICSNGASDWPTCTPPTGTCSNGASNWPVCTPPTCSNGASDYPVCTPPTCSNGASNWPVCTPPTCSNGASDYPVCTPPTCPNGAADWPTCTPPTNPSTYACNAEGDWYGSFVPNYRPASTVLFGISFVGCYLPHRPGMLGEKIPMSCGYVWNGGSYTEYPEVPTGENDSSVTKTGSKTSTCTNTGWTK